MNNIKTAIVLRQTNTTEHAPEQETPHRPIIMNGSPTNKYRIPRTTKPQTVTANATQQTVMPNTVMPQAAVAPQTVRPQTITPQSVTPQTVTPQIRRNTPWREHCGATSQHLYIQRKVLRILFMYVVEICSLLLHEIHNSCVEFQNLSVVHAAA
jgi:hypothetical protein